MWLIIVLKVGWITTDNATNNVTMMAVFEDLLKVQEPNTEFAAESCHIR